MNTFGERFRLTTYGESHGFGVGGVVDGCPAGIALDEEAIAVALARRGCGAPRKEPDSVKWLSGIKEGITLGTPIAFVVENRDARSHDYAALEHCFRPGHADFTYAAKYGVRDARGGGRASGRETVARVVGGSIARQLMPEVNISATSIVGHPMTEDDTVGGYVVCRIEGLNAGVGEPIFDKLNARLAYAMMSIPSAIGFEMGSGFNAAAMKGSEYIDRWAADGSGRTITNHCGGTQGGLSNGMPVEFRVAFHPVVTLPQAVECLHEEGRLVNVEVGGRHDRAAIERMPVIVESMAALCLINYLL